MTTYEIFKDEKVLIAFDYAKSKDKESAWNLAETDFRQDWDYATFRLEDACGFYKGGVLHVMDLGKPVSLTQEVPKGVFVSALLYSIFMDIGTSRFSEDAIYKSAERYTILELILP